MCIRDSTMNVLLLFFDGMPAKFIEECNERLIIGERKRSLTPSEREREKNESFNNHSLMLQTIFRTCQGPQYKASLAYFIAKVVGLKKYDIDFQTAKETACYLIENPLMMSKWKFKDAGRTLSTNEAIIELYDEEKSGLIMDILKNHEEMLLKEGYTDLLHRAELSPFLDVFCYLLSLREEYRKAFEIYLNCRNQTIKVKVFGWLEEVLNRLDTQKNKTELEEMKDLILVRLKDLVQISMSHTQLIISKFNKSAEKKVILGLASNPQMQFEYLRQMMLEREKDKNVKIDNELLILHIELLCRLYPKDVVPALKQYDYPLDDCLNVCSKYKNDDARAYLLERTGAVFEALQLHLDLLEKLVEKNVKRLESNKSLEAEQILKRLDAARDLCKANSKFSDLESEKLWFILLDLIMTIYKRHILAKIGLDRFKSLTDLYSKIFEIIFDDLVRYVALTSILEKIEEYGSISLRDLKKCILNMLSNYAYEENILTNAKRLIMDDIIDSGLLVMYEYTRGLNSEIKRDVDVSLSDKLLAYYCGHTYPRRLTNNQMCPSCSRSDNYQLINLILQSQTNKGKVNIPGLSTAKSNRNMLDSRDRMNSSQNMGDMTPSTASEAEFQKKEAKDVILRKLKVFDSRKEDEIIFHDSFKEKYDKML
eukprot:TRINITY_DN8740_c0_g1_i4.p1 TRINITY_DN8740_c0_g1~~TRINITY_DN8740_c0_g1_i4.p1  ORF type:complete len:680 (-),score=183.53 TRINITY_DN8740_c0_g1_i4:180-2135(-)